MKVCVPVDAVATRFLDNEKNAEDPEWLAQYFLPRTDSLVE